MAFRWRGITWPPLTDTECAENTRANAEHSMRLLRLARQTYQTSMPGSDQCRKAHEEMCQHASDVRHWREMSEWYRQRVEADNGA